MRRRESVKTSANFEGFHQIDFNLTIDISLDAPCDDNTAIQWFTFAAGAKLAFAGGTRRYLTVIEVTADGRADRAGLMPGDVISCIEGQTVGSFAPSLNSMLSVCRALCAGMGSAPNPPCKLSTVVTKTQVLCAAHSPQERHILITVDRVHCNLDAIPFHTHKGGDKNTGRGRGIRTRRMLLHIFVTILLVKSFVRCASRWKQLCGSVCDGEWYRCLTVLETQCLPLSAQFRCQLLESSLKVIRIPGKNI